MKQTVSSWMEQNVEAARCARDWLSDCQKPKETVDHLRKRHGYPFKSAAYLKAWYTGKTIVRKKPPIEPGDRRSAILATREKENEHGS